MPDAGSAISAFSGSPAGTSTLLGAVGAGTKAVGNFASGNYRADVAINNQSIANDNADLAIFKGNQSVGVSQQRTAQMVGADRAGSGASGIDANSGSAMRTQADTARIGAIDAQTIQQNAQRSAWGYRVQAGAFGADSTLDRMTGDFGAASSLVGGASDFADKWSKWQTNGVPGTGG